MPRTTCAIYVRLLFFCGGEPIQVRELRVRKPTRNLFRSDNTFMVWSAKLCILHTILASVKYRMTTAPDRPPGEIIDQGVRYLMMRPDVLMGIAHELPPQQAVHFLQALGKSVFRNAQASFQQYRTQGSLAPDQLLAKSFGAAAHLGWGHWTLERARDGSYQVEVRNSPFAAGFGSSPVPVCTAIAGALGGMLLVAYDLTIDVRESICAAQGGPACRFALTGLELLG